MPRLQHKYHFIYKTTNIKNGKYYIGMHSTSNLDDGYIGSGNRIRRAIRKHGKENFKFEVLEFFDCRELLAQREKELITEELLRDPMCMNLKKGGEGGWHIHATNAFKEKLKNLEFKQKFSEACSNRNKKLLELGTIKSWKETCNWTGRNHRPDTLKKMKNSKINHGIGESNSQFGTRWITNGNENKKIKINEVIPLNWYKGRILKSK